MVGLQFTPIMTSLGSLAERRRQLQLLRAGHEVPGHRGVPRSATPKKAAEAKVDPLGFYLPPFNYAIGQMLEQAVNATKSLDHKKLADYLRKNEMKTIVGPIRYGPDGEWANARVVQAQFRGVADKDMEQFRQAGKQVVLYPDAVQDRRRSSRRSRKRAASSRASPSTMRRGDPAPHFFREPMFFSLDLLFEAVLFGILLGCFYAAVSIGLSVSFGLLDVPHVAHPAIMVLGSYCTCAAQQRWASTRSSPASLLMPPFFVLGMAHLPLLLRDLREARQRRRGARHRLLLRRRADHRGRPDPRRSASTSAWSRRAYIGKSLSLRRHAHPAAHAGGLRRGARADGRRSRSTCRRPSPAAPSRRWRRTSRRCA